MNIVTLFLENKEKGGVVKKVVEDVENIELNPNSIELHTTNNRYHFQYKNIQKDKDGGHKFFVRRK